MDSVKGNIKGNTEVLKKDAEVLNFKKRGLSLTQKKCAELLVLRDINGLSMIDLAKEVGVSKQTIYNWKATKEFNDYLNDLADEFHRSFLPDAFSQLRTILLHGKNHEKLKAIELMLKNQGKLKDNTEINATVKTDLSTDEYLKQLGL